VVGRLFPRGLIEIRPVTAEEVRPIRRRVLRAGLPRPNVRFEGDDAGDTLHVAAFLEGRLVAAATVARRPPPDDPSTDTAWQVRGMATEPAVRGRGLGGELLERCIRHVERLAAASSGATRESGPCRSTSGTGSSAGARCSRSSTSARVSGCTAACSD
jgi:GNAT superfamily N-acetyltransferase